MLRDVAVVRLERIRHEPPVVAQDVEGLTERHREAAELHDVTAETQDASLERLLVVSHRAAAEHLVLEILGSVFELLDDLEIGVGDLIDEGIEGSRGAGEGRTGSPALEGRAEVERGREADRDDPVRRTERVELHLHEIPPGGEGQGTHHDEAVAAEELDLRPLAAMASVFDGERVQVEALLQGRHLLHGRVLDVEPDPRSVPVGWAFGPVELLRGSDPGLVHAVPHDHGAEPTAADRPSRKRGREARLHSATVPVPDHVHRFWKALDELFARVRPTRWGAVITDGRYPRIWDTNYARVDVADDSLRLADVEGELLPSLHEAGASTFHVVTFHPEDTTPLLAELSSRGHRLSWDLVMNADPARSIEAPNPSIDVEEVPPSEELWASVAASFALFGVDPGEAVEQLRGIEQDVLVPGGKRWFAIRDETGAIASLAALLTLGAVGYVDNVATFPHARRRGYAAALTARIVHEARQTGATNVCLFADPDDEAVIRLYGGLGFEEAGRLASTRGPLPG